MRLVFAEPAERDLEDIIDYISLDSPNAAEKVYRAIVASARRLTEFPHMGRVGRLPGVRELVVPSLPYLIAYQADAEAVTILAVFHGARDLPRAFAERQKTLRQ